MTNSSEHSQFDTPVFTEHLINSTALRNLIILTTAAFSSSVAINLYKGESVLVVAGLVIITVMLFCLWRLLRYPSDHLAYSVYIYSIAIAVIFPTYINMHYGALWSHTVNVAAFLVLGKSAALVFNSFYILVIALTIGFSADLLSAARTAGTSALLVVFAYTLVTHIEERSITLMRKVQKLKKAESVKAEFIANMSHEMRTPLTAVIGYAQNILIANDLSESNREKIQSILVGGEQLSCLVDDVLDMAKADEGQLSVRPESTEIIPLLDTLKRILDQAADAKGIDFSLVTHLPLPRKIYTDPMRLKQIIMNLAGNAIKFTDKGSVELAVDYDLDGQCMVFRISDTGIGIPEEFRSKLFERFSQEDTSTNRKYGGSGLGLYISQQLASLLNSHVEYIPQERGSVFQLTLATRLVSDEWVTEDQSFIGFDPHGYDEEKQHRGHALIVDDSPVNQHLIGLFLEKFGLEYSKANNGQEAVDMLRKQSFDLVLMDIQMPVMSGVEATKAIRVFNSKIPIVALSADVLRHPRESLKAHGFTDFLAKPIDIEKLQQVLAQLLPGRTK